LETWRGPSGATGQLSSARSMSSFSSRSASLSCSAQASLQVTCQLQPPRPSTCSVNYGYGMSGNGASLQKEASGNVQTDVSVGERDGKASVSVGMVSVSGTMKVSVAGMSEGGKEEFRFGPWSATSSGKASDKSNSGDWSDGNGTHITWSFARE